MNKKTRESENKLPPNAPVVKQQQQQDEAVPTESVTIETPYILFHKILTIFKNNNTNINIRSEDISVLLKLKFPNGDDIISLDRRDIIIEIISMFKEQDISSVVDFLQHARNNDDISWNQYALK